MSTQSTVLIAVAVPLVLGLLSRTRPSARTENGKSFVEYGLGFKGFSILLLVVALGVAALAIFVPRDKAWVICTSLVFAVPGAYLFLEAFFVRISFSPHGLEAFSPWRKYRFVHWDDVADVTCQGSTWHIIHTHKQGEITLSNMMSGHQALLDALRERGVNGA